MGRPKLDICRRGHPRTSDTVDRFRGCKQCNSIRANEWKKANREKVQAMHIRWMYGVSDIPAICDVCGGVNANGRKIHVDHDHTTGAVRGFLCSGCNSALGLVKEDPERLRKLAEYIERSK